MKKVILSLAALFAAFSLVAQNENKLKYVDVNELEILGRGWTTEQLGDPFVRIPLALKDSCNAQLWNNLECTAGMSIRFRTNSTKIWGKWTLRHNSHMNHMADSGIKGADLYFLDDKGKWIPVYNIRPKNDFQQEAEFVTRLDGSMHECCIFLPLYDGVTKMEIGVDPDAIIEKPVYNSPKKERGKIIWYGTSILQGGCASRCGMASTNIVQRELDIECVNIATSGQGKMYYHMARALAQIENVACYVIDPVPNCTLDDCKNLTVNFVNIIRKAHPDTPIIMVDGPMYPYAKFDSYLGKYLPEKNEAFHAGYEQLRKENPKNIYYVTCEGLTGVGEEGTVDGIHLTDYGFRGYADTLEKTLRKVLKIRK